MKKLIFLVLLFPSLCFGWTNPYVAGCVAAASCSPSSNEIGDRTDHTTGYPLSDSVCYCYLYTADCSGTLEYANIKHSGTNSEKVKIGVFADDGDNAPDGGDTQVGNWVEITSSTDGWVSSSATKVTGSVTTSAKYWVCFVSDTSTFDVYRDTSGGTVYYIYNAYSSPPSTLAGSWSSTADRSYSIYVGIE